MKNLIIILLFIIVCFSCQSNQEQITPEIDLEQSCQLLPGYDWSLFEVIEQPTIGATLEGNEDCGPTFIFKVKFIGNYGCGYEITGRKFLEFNYGWNDPDIAWVKCNGSEYYGTFTNRISLKSQDLYYGKEWTFELRVANDGGSNNQMTFYHITIDGGSIVNSDSGYYYGSDPYGCS